MTNKYLSKDEDVKYSDFAQAFSEVFSDYVSKINLPSIWDFQNINSDLLPFAAFDNDCHILYTQALGEQFIRDLLENIEYITTFRGTWAAIDRFAQVAKFQYSYIWNYTGTIKTTIDLYVTIPLLHTNNTDYLIYLERAIRWLLPYPIDVHSITIAHNYSFDLYLGISHPWVYTYIEV